MGSFQHMEPRCQSLPLPGESGSLPRRAVALLVAESGTDVGWIRQGVRRNSRDDARGGALHGNGHPRKPEDPHQSELPETASAAPASTPAPPGCVQIVSETEERNPETARIPLCRAKPTIGLEPMTPSLPSPAAEVQAQITLGRQSPWKPCGFLTPVFGLLILAPDQLSRSDVSEMCLSWPPFHNRLRAPCGWDGGAHKRCARFALGEEQGCQVVMAQTSFSRTRVSGPVVPKAIEIRPSR